MIDDPLFATAFYAIGAILLLSSLAVVILPNIVHSALSLVMSFAAVAGLYVLLRAEFVAIVQVIIYAGAVMVLLLFAVMLTQRSNSRLSNLTNTQAPAAAVLSLLLFVIMAAVFVGTSWPVQDVSLPADITARLGDMLFGQYVLAFEVASLLLLAAMIGAIVVAREG